jgi:hypothetical protein
MLLLGGDRSFTTLSITVLVNNGPDLLGRWGAGTEIGTALFWDRA